MAPNSVRQSSKFKANCPHNGPNVRIGAAIMNVLEDTACQQPNAHYFALEKFLSRH